MPGTPQLGFWETLDRSAVEPICNWFKGYYGVDNWGHVSASDIEALCQACKAWQEYGGGELIDAPFLYRTTVIPVDKHQIKRFRTVGALVSGYKARAAAGHLELVVPELLAFTPFPHVASTYARHNQAPHVLAQSTPLDEVRHLSVIIKVPSNSVQLLLSSTTIIGILQKHHPTHVFNYLSPARWAMYREARKLRSRMRVVWDYGWAHECICRIHACELRVAGVLAIEEIPHVSLQELVDMDPRIGPAEIVWHRLRRQWEGA